MNSTVPPACIGSAFLAMRSFILKLQYIRQKVLYSKNNLAGHEYIQYLNLKRQLFKCLENQSISYLKAMMFGCFSFLRCLISVSLCSLTFLMATSSARNLPKKTAPCAPLPSHCSSEISSNGTSHVSDNNQAPSVIMAANTSLLTSSHQMFC